MVQKNTICCENVKNISKNIVENRKIIHFKL